MKKTTIILIIGIILILIIGVVIFVLPKPSAPKKEVVPSIPEAQFSPTPVEFFRIASVEPKQDISREYLPNQPVEFQFNLLLNADTINYKVSPQVKTNLHFKKGSNTTLIISPITTWAPGITTITILKEAISSSGIKMTQDFSYKINSNFPKTAPPDSQGL